jgi:hypothetical protein
MDAQYKRARHGRYMAGQNAAILYCCMRSPVTLQTLVAGQPEPDPQNKKVLNQPALRRLCRGFLLLPSLFFYSWQIYIIWTVLHHRVHLDKCSSCFVHSIDRETYKANFRDKF